MANPAYRPAAGLLLLVALLLGHAAALANYSISEFFTDPLCQDRTTFFRSLAT